MEIKIDKNIKNQKKKKWLKKKKFKDVQNYRLRNPNVYISQTHNKKKNIKIGTGSCGIQKKTQK